MRCAVLLLLALATMGFPSRAAASTPDEAALAGQALFVGRTRMHNGGPSCASCHNAAGLPFPYGGDMGPDLTDEYSKLGANGLRYALATLFFPAMNPLFVHHPLTPNEQASLGAFLRSVDQQRPIQTALGPLTLAAVAGLLGLLLLTALYGRTRVRSVRRALLERVAKERTRGRPL